MTEGSSSMIKHPATRSPSSSCPDPIKYLCDFAENARFTDLTAVKSPAQDNAGHLKPPRPFTRWVRDVLPAAGGLTQYQ